MGIGNYKNFLIFNDFNSGIFCDMASKFWELISGILLTLVDITRCLFLLLFPSINTYLYGPL